MASKACVPGTDTGLRKAEMMYEGKMYDVRRMYDLF